MRVSLLLPAAIALLAAAVWAAPQTGPAFSQLVYPGPDGRLVYVADREGNTIPDFSCCGYGGGGVPIPNVPVKVTIHPETAGDDTERIQAAINQVAGLPLGADGFRGAVVLAKGRYRVEGTLTLSTSGVVLRGGGQGEDGTLLIAAGKKPRPLFQLRGKAAPQGERDTRQPITDARVPVGARSFAVADGSRFKAGDTVTVSRAGNAAWIHEIGMDRIAERPGHPGSTKQWGPFSLGFDRVITRVDGNRITVDAPLACAVEARWGGGEVTRTVDAGRIEHVGVEKLRAVSEFDRAVTAEEKGQRYFSDEQHADYLVNFANVKNAWARELTTVSFAHGVASLAAGAKWVTVRDCSSLDPVSVLTGGRRYPFSITGAQLCLVRGCYSRGARHAFVFGSRVPGPNVFLECRSEQDHATSEPHHRWSVGGLYDNVSAQMAIQDRQWMGSGHGWAGANYVTWNCTGSLVCQQPPTAQNWAIGFVGKKSKGAFVRPDGWWESFGRHVEPRSLCLKQLEDRLGKGAAVRQP